MFPVASWKILTVNSQITLNHRQVAWKTHDPYKLAGGPPPFVHFQATTGGYRVYSYIIIYSSGLLGMLKKYPYKYAFDTNSIFLW